MTDETPGRGDHSPTPDSISEAVDNESQTHPETDASNEISLIKDYSQPSTSVRTAFETPRSGDQQSSSTETTNERERDNIDRPTIAPCAIPPRLSLNCEIQLPGSSSSAFRPFISDSEPIVVSPDNNPKSPTQSQQPLLISTPTSRRQTIPGSTVSIPASSLSSDSPNPDQSDGMRENSSMNDDNDDGRTTASAPPCTPAPESHAQSQSPFRNSRPIKRIDLLAMSRSRQSDRAENARRDGRLAPSPRKKDEVLRNSGYLCPANRSYGFQSNLRLTSNEGLISPERMSNGPSSAASPQVDVVSVDDHNDASKHKMNVQFHSRDHAEQMMKCNLCGFVTNNLRFYRRHRRLHTRQHPLNHMQCSHCDYSTNQIRRLREHTMTHQNLPSQSTSANPHFRSSDLGESSRQSLPFANHFFLPSGNMYPPDSCPITLPLSAVVPTSVISNSVSLGGLHAFVPAAAATATAPATAAAPQEHQLPVQVNEQIQHPPRGSALLGNCSPNTGQVANYMRSVLSNLISPTRTHAPSSVTTSSLYRSIPHESQSIVQSQRNNPSVIDDAYLGRFWNHNSNNPSALPGRNVPSSTYVKIKAEPRTIPISQIPHVVNDVPSSTQQDRHNNSNNDISPHHHTDNVDSESGMDMSGDERPSSPLPAYIESRFHTRGSTESSHTDNTGGGGDVNPHCSMPFIKIEFPSNSEPCNWLRRTSLSQCDRGVQCDIISMSGNHHHRSGRTQSETVSSAGAVSDSKCHYCGVTFDDEVLYSIHVGCHSHTDPFVCNVCGKQCHNKYGFYSHIMRGHQSRPNT